ncbi:sugar-transfer associated ATP-grasp domain-containing protein [Marinobacter fonticola]|uniref:sugar-transfer associated ATP-grasp domain-containing protein n=1 Tax=Marinobacter fonticola TaxID=2603215 RepID=UPI0011E684D5|nr:sugar-transfer associated ATP-grasp domain-containing protein [Marinobacter fonticola]
MGIRQKYRNVRRFLEMDRRQSPERDLGMLKQGFFSKRRQFYPFDQYDKSLFLTDWEIEFGFPLINSPSSQEPLKNKVFFNLMLRQAGLDNYTPGLLGTIDNGRFCSFSSYRTPAELFDDNRSLFLKPISGAGGLGCCVIERHADIPKEGSYLIERQATAHDYARQIFPDSINTIRVFTIKDSAGKTQVVGAAHRFGGRSNSPIDNFSKGGISCGIDLDSGKLGRGVSNPGFYQTIFHDHHPVSNAMLTGVTIPYWESVKSLALKLADHFYSLNYAGWDIYVSPTGAMVIEGNAHIANPNLIQVHKPLLISEAFRERLHQWRVLSDSRIQQIERALSLEAK